MYFMQKSCVQCDSYISQPPLGLFGLADNAMMLGLQTLACLIVSYLFRNKAPLLRPYINHLSKYKNKKLSCQWGLILSFNATDRTEPKLLQDHRLTTAGLPETLQAVTRGSSTICINLAGGGISSSRRLGVLMTFLVINQCVTARRKHLLKECGR